MSEAHRCPCCADRSRAKADLAALRVENGSLKGERDEWHRKANGALQDSIDAERARDELAALTRLLVEALHPYLQHRLTCAIHRPNKTTEFPACTCGLDAAPIAALENLLDSLPMEAVSRYARLPENDDDGRTLIYRRAYYDALVELRKHRPAPNALSRLVGRCALCGGDGTLMVEGRRGPIVRMACPNCAHKPPCPTCGGTGKYRYCFAGLDEDETGFASCPDCAGGKKG